MDICQLYNEGNSSTEISRITKISLTTIVDYLKQGAASGFCNYTSQNVFNKKFLVNQGYVNLKTKEDLHNAKLDFICKYYNANCNMSGEQIAKQLGISNTTVCKFLKIGTELGYCNYKIPDTKFKKNHVYHAHELKSA